MFKLSYFSIFTFFVFCSVLSSIIFFLSYSVSLKEEDPEKLSMYECGFNPFTDSKNEFSVKFFLVAMLFIIFDLEMSFLFPYSASIDTLNYLGCFSMIFFFSCFNCWFFMWVTKSSFSLKLNFSLLIFLSAAFWLNFFSFSLFLW